MILRLPDAEECPLHTGHIYRRKLPRVQGLPQFRVLTARKQQLRTVTHQDALNEGFQGTRARQAFMLDWVRRHDKHARRHRSLSDARVMELWRSSHANAWSWVLTIELVEAESFLADQRRKPDPRGKNNAGQYSTSASVDPLPVMGPSRADINQARVWGAQKRAEDRARREQTAAVARAHRAAKRNRERARATG